MTAQTLTVISGVVLLLVFVLVGWNLRRPRDSNEGKDRRPHERTPR